MAHEADYRRVLIDLGHAADQGGVRAAVGLAGLLRLDLLGVFVEDEAVLGLAGLPFARELRLPACTWCPIDADRIAVEFEGAARRARQRLAEQSAVLGVPSASETVRGDPAAALAARARASDILVLGEPGTAAERAAGSLPRAVQAALRSAAAVMLLPPRLAREAGPVAAVAMAEVADPALRVAAAIAAAARERLLLLLAPMTSGTGGRTGAAAEAARATARTAGLAEDRILVREMPALAADAILESLEGWEERLLVLSRGTARAARADIGPGLPAHRLQDAAAVPRVLTAARGVPALLVGPPDPIPREGDPGHSS